MMGLWFITGLVVGVMIMAVLSANSYNKGYQDGIRAERWRNHYPTLRR